MSGRIASIVACLLLFSAVEANAVSISVLNAYRYASAQATVLSVTDSTNDSSLALSGTFNANLDASVIYFYPCCYGIGTASTLQNSTITSSANALDITSAGYYHTGATGTSYTTAASDSALSVEFNVDETVNYSLDFWTDHNDSLRLFDSSGDTFNTASSLTQSGQLLAGTYTLAFYSRMFVKNNLELYGSDTLAFNISSTGTSVPEPSTLLLLGSGLTGLGFIRRRLTA